MKKRNFVIALMAMLLVAGCGASDQPAASGEPTDQPAEQAAENSGSEAEPQDGAEAKTYDITVSFASFDNTFASFCMARMEAYNEEHPELNITYIDGANDSATQINQIEQAVINGTEAVIALVVDATQSQPIVTACNDAGIPFIAFNRVCEGCDTFVGADNADAGRLVAERAIELLNGEGKIALVQGVMGQANTYERTNAILETLESSNVEVVLDGAADWKRDKALELVETWLQSGTEFDLVIALNDDAALGAQQALAGAGKENDIPVLSINGDPSGIEGVEKGTLDCTAFQAPFVQADKALEYAVQYIDGTGTPPEADKVEYELITADNVADYLQYKSVQ